MSAQRQHADLKAIGARIRQLRGHVHQEELAAYLGVSQGHLSKIERGQWAPTVEMLVRLSERFKTNIDWIVTGQSA
ncbi:MAG: helix-turn-helix domain-containing protein [Terriglobales bacterium]